MDELLPRIGGAAVRRAIRMGACSIYHGCVHNMIYEKSAEIRKGLYKSASFVVQEVCFLQTGNYIRRQKELLEMVSPAERAIVDTFLMLKNGGEVDFDEMSDMLFAWCGKWIGK